MYFLRLIKSESYKRGTVLSVLFNIVSKAILFLLTIIIARYFGSNIKTDIYFFVFATMILFSSFVNAIDTSVLIPESMLLREKQGEESAAAFLNYFLLIYTLIGLLFTVAMYFFGTKVFSLISKFSETDILTYKNYFLIGSLFFIFHVLTNYLNNILTSLKYFSVPMIISSFKSCIVIVCIFLLKNDYDVLSVFIGGLISYAINLFMQLYFLHKVAGWRFNLRRISIRKKIWSNVFYAELGQVATVASSMFPLYLLSGFGSGIISVMNYGKNIADIPNTLVTSQFSNVSGIKLNEEVARRDFAAMNETFLRTSKLLVFLLVPMGFFCFVFATPIVQLFYQSKNFSDSSVADAALFLKLLSVTIFSMGINAMVTRLFIAIQAIKQAFFYQVILNTMLIIAIWIFTKYYGAFGYPIGMIVINIVNFFAMYIICKKLVPQIQYTEVMKYTSIIILLNAAIAEALYFALNYISLNVVLHFVSGFLLYAVILIWLNKKFKLNTELLHIIKYFKHRFY
jgi:peptidoglycan biosynthesis protein MviN/MurJ (putative lipid II flippase)